MPFVVCAATIAAMGVVAAVIRGDRVMRVGMIGVAATSLPWAICSALSVCTDDPDTATRLLRLGGAPVALVGPSLLLVLLGLSGQLERHRWVARLAGIVGAVLLGLSLGTDWMVPGVHRLRSGVLYASPGPLTDVHVAQLAIWIAVGLVIARRSMMRGERRRMMRVAIAACVLALIAGTDMLLVHDVIDGFPVAWLPVTIACGALLYLELATDLLRPRGVDPVAVVELAGLAVATVAIGALAGLLHGAAPIAIAVIASAVWMSVIAIAWGLGRGRAPAPVLVADALVRFTAELSDLDDDRPIAAALAALWQHAAIAVRATWRAEPDGLVEVATGARWALDRDLAAWLARHGEPLAAADLATMRLGAIRPKVEALVVERGATLFVPLLDRGALVGLVEADHMLALREAERGLVAESARAAARALTYVELARLAAREGATAREVEVAEAMRRQASASRDAELGPWRVAAEYRSAARTTGAAWSANLLDDGRLAILVTEGQAHGVVAALATAAVTGAFAAATTGGAPSLDDLLAILRTSAERVLHGERIAAFVAIASAETQAISWACAGHPGAFLVEQGAETQDPRLLGGGGARLGDPSDDPSDGPSDGPSDRVMRGEAPFGPDRMLVVASTGVRGSASRAWYGALRAHRAAGSRLAALLVDAVADHGTASEDLLAVVIRSRGDVERGDC
jgi:hypothetical protein